MKKIAVILPVNNPEMIVQKDLECYQTAECHYELSYIDTHLKELNSEADGMAVLQPTINAAIMAEKNGADAIIIFAFGDVAVKDANAKVSIPVMGAGKYAIHVAAEICQNAFTVLPGKLQHNDFIEPMITDMGLAKNFILASHTPDLFPAEIRLDTERALVKLFEAACQEIESSNVDTLTMGCGCFMGMAKPLQKKLQAYYQGQRKITVIDPAEIAFAIVRELV